MTREKQTKIISNISERGYQPIKPSTLNSSIFEGNAGYQPTVNNSDGEAKPPKKI